MTKEEFVHIKVDLNPMTFLQPSQKSLGKTQPKSTVMGTRDMTPVQDQYTHQPQIGKHSSSGFNVGHAQTNIP